MNDQTKTPHPFDIDASAVALAYDGKNAPQIVAKGHGELAQDIIEQHTFLAAGSPLTAALVDMAAEVAPALKITRDDINNKVRRIRDPAQATATGSFTGNSIPFNRQPNCFHRFCFKHFC